MVEEIISELGDNYNSADRDVIETILEEVTANALTISNLEDNVKNQLYLKQEIKTCVKSIYLQRGAESLNSLSERGISSNFKDSMEKLRNDIIRNGKRRCY